MKTVSASTWKAVGGLLLAGLVVVALLWMDRGSLERANRLYRSGDVAAAVEVYRGVLLAADEDGVPSYNLGTALLGVDLDEAERRLAVAVQGTDSAAAQRGHYNLGYRYLAGLNPAAEPDVILSLLSAAVGSSRAALRMDPTDENARWNLALAQRMLDSLNALATGDTSTSPRNRSDAQLTGDSEESADPGDGPASVDPGDFEMREAAAGAGEGAADAPADARAARPSADGFTRSSNDASAGDDFSGQGTRSFRAGDLTAARRAPGKGSVEAAAGLDLGPVSEVAAQQTIEEDVDDVPGVLIRGILWAHRPVVAWWDSQPFPGGDW